MTCPNCKHEMSRKVGVCSGCGWKTGTKISIAREDLKPNVTVTEDIITPAPIAKPVVTPVPIPTRPKVEVKEPVKEPVKVPIKEPVHMEAPIRSHFHSKKKKV